jgi:hypothetical protein
VVKYRPPSYTLCSTTYHVGWEFIDESDCSSFLVVMDLLGLGSFRSVSLASLTVKGRR